jgi:hypothetical protein
VDRLTHNTNHTFISSTLCRGGLNVQLSTQMPAQLAITCGENLERVVQNVTDNSTPHLHGFELLLFCMFQDFN